jgi:hypothetical protein
MSGRIRFRTRFCSVDFRRFEPAVLAGPPLLFISMLSINLVLREPQDAVLRTALQDEVCGDQLYPSDLISFMESVHQIILNSDLFGAHDPEFIVPDGAGNKLLGR